MDKDKVIKLHFETGRGSVDLDFNHTVKVDEAAKIAAMNKEYPDDNYVLIFNGEQLMPERTLESYHFNDGDTVVLSAAGDSY